VAGDECAAAGCDVVYPPDLVRADERHSERVLGFRRRRGLGRVECELEDAPRV
jgi:hypothetical protein